jgi:hypothetical protein
MTGAAAAFFLMRLGWIPLGRGERVHSTKLGEGQCGQCQRYVRSTLVNLTRYQRIYLCEKCRGKK